MSAGTLLSIPSPLPAGEALDRLRASLTEGAVRRISARGRLEITGAVNASMIRLKPVSIGAGGRLYRPELIGSLAPADTGSRLTGYLRSPGRRYAAFWFTGVALFLLLGIAVGLVGGISGQPVKSDQGSNLFPAILVPPLIMLPIGATLHAYYSRLATKASDELVRRISFLLDAGTSPGSSG